MGGKSGKGESKIPVVDYYLSVHFALCHGPIDAIRRVVVKEKEAWRGLLASIVPTTFSVNRPDLFGGNKKEGGVAGSVEFYPGSLEQKASANLAGRFRRTPDTMPGYRGVATLFFNGGGAGSAGGSGGATNNGGVQPGGQLARNGLLPSVGSPNAPGYDTRNRSYGFDDIPLDRKGGFLWSSNNPYLPETWVTASRLPRTPLPAAHAAIPNLVPEAIIGLPKDENEDEQEDDEDDDDDDDDEEPVVPDAENQEPLNGYYIGALPTEQNFVKTQYGYKGTSNSVDADPTFERRIFDVANQQKLKIAGCVYRNYGDDANPAHIILESMMDTTWGMGAPESAFDIPSFASAAATLFAEKFGLSILWTEQSTIESMVSEILDHIQAVLFLHPRTGLFTLRLLRNDYDAGALRLLTPDNADLSSFQRKGWGETTNEIVVTWTNPENEKESTVTLQDLGNIAIQGGIVTDNRNYYGVRSATLANRLCARDLRSASAPLATFEALLLRSEWDIVPGEVIRVDWPEEGIAGAVFRIMDVDYGKVGASAIKVKFMEDVFALPTQGYVVGGPARPVNADGRPSPLDHLLFMTPPPQILARVGAMDAEFPDAAVLVLGASDNAAVERFELRSSATAPDGTELPVSLGQKAVTTHGKLAQPLPKEFESRIVAFSATTRETGQPSVGGLLILGATEAAHEICMFEGYDPDTGYRLARGMLDTVPRAWPADTPLWIIEFGQFDALDPTRRAATVPVDYALLTRTVSEQLPEEDAQERTFTPSDRLWRPARPANCRIEGQAFRYVVPDAPIPATVALSWSTRNAAMEDSVFPRWTDGPVTADIAQTTTIRVVDAAAAVVFEETEIAGGTFDLPVAELPSGELRVLFFSHQNDLDSLQAYAVELKVPPRSGYGFDYGNNYGGTP